MQKHIVSASRCQRAVASGKRLVGSSKLRFVEER
jgi:hypothetical protein